MQITRYRITEEGGGLRYTEKIHEAREAANAGKKVEKRRVSINERHGRGTPLSQWKLATFEEAKKDRVIQYRVYLNPSERFDTLDREKAVRHWKEGCIIYSRAVNYYPTTKGIHPVGYWNAHPQKEKNEGRYPELKDEDVAQVTKEENDVSGMG